MSVPPPVFDTAMVCCEVAGVPPARVKVRLAGLTAIVGAGAAAATIDAAFLLVSARAEAGVGCFGVASVTTPPVSLPSNEEDASICPRDVVCEGEGTGGRVGAGELMVDRRKEPVVDDAVDTLPACCVEVTLGCFNKVFDRFSVVVSEEETFIDGVVLAEFFLDSLRISEC